MPRRKNSNRRDDIPMDISDSDVSEEETKKITKKRKQRDNNTKTEKTKKTKRRKIIEEETTTDDEDVDEKGNIKDLIDYNFDDKKEEEKKEDDPDIDNGYNLDSDSDDESDSSKEEEYNHQDSIGIIFSTLLGGSPPLVPPRPSKHEAMKKRIDETKMTDDMKDKLKRKLDTCNLDEKQNEWFENLLKIKFGHYSPLPVDVKKDDVGKYFKDLMATLDKVVYGLKDVKEEIVNYVAQCLTTTNPSSRILALCGSAGTGKTKIVREGISKALNRPMKTFSMGGIKDSQHLVGFDYTYMNSKHGAIAQCIMDSQVMNPVIFLDELDKISKGWEGEEIENLLIHITDVNQNHDFKDKYFDGVPIDLSKVIFIFAFNDIERLNPILRDRLHIINIPSPTEKDKLIIVKDYVINELLGNIGISKSDFDITDDAYRHIINKYSKTDGIRTLKDCIETILKKVNTIKLLGKTVSDIGLSFSLKDYSLPLKITEKNVDIFLRSHESDTSSVKYPSMYT